jgi:hypothetical protein
MKHAQSTGTGRVYDEKTHQWVEADEAPPAKPARRAKAKPAPEPALVAEAGATDNKPQSAEE